tara:strand:- start:4469 stop:4912 length:444 start_codon:yes stop_codon:yes gene_type:complete
LAKQIVNNLSKEKDMNDVYAAPKSDVTLTGQPDNNSGMKQNTLPDGIAGFSWGAFSLNWIWGGFNKTYIGFLALVPYIGFIVAIYLGFKGRELAWKNKKWDSVEHFNRVQKKWSIWGLCLLLIPLIGIIAAIAIPAYQDYVLRAGGI